jgi:hypothetical protein
MEIYSQQARGPNLQELELERRESEQVALDVDVSSPRIEFLVALLATQYSLGRYHLRRDSQKVYLGPNLATYSLDVTLPYGQRLVKFRYHLIMSSSYLIEVPADNLFREVSKPCGVEAYMCHCVL